MVDQYSNLVELCNHLIIEEDSHSNLRIGSLDTGRFNIIIRLLEQFNNCILYYLKEFRIKITELQYDIQDDPR